ncbi:hypothetical protein HGA92_00945 [Candidatus Gracilibacteria bacterium]|nr:hypothetical protein [Candidatus Gracilibacteria bacterium]NUJ98823.1 hypothetical protein [Candidatus Gracilibacteria bacterium]
MLHKKKKGFTLVEILIGIIIVVSVIITGFYALTHINIGKIKLIEETSIEKEAFYFSEKLFEFIKKGGVIDYEEYFNRQNVGIGSFIDGHYSLLTGFGNLEDEFYYCRSGNANSMGTGGCVNTIYNTSGVSLLSNPLIFGQYAYQFIDYNSNADDDLGDEDGDGNIQRDDDDEYLGFGPEAFIGPMVDELYLINGSKTKRTFLRWNVAFDPNAPTGATCDGLIGNPSSITGSGCLGNIQFLKLEGMDWGNDHNEITQDDTQYDGIIDTWIFDREVYGLTNAVVADSNPGSDVYDHDSENYWINLFPNTINIENINFFLYPTKDIHLAWKETNPDINIAPYLRIDITLTPSWRKRAGINGRPPEFNFSTTLSLSDIFAK